MQQLQPGDILTDLEGYDVGSGAVVVEIRGEDVKLFLLDTNAVDDVIIGPDRAYSVEQDAIDEINPLPYDVLRLDSPSTECDIRTLPNYWGPRDRNMPSTMTDVTWRPEDYWNRWQHRWYANREAEGAVNRTGQPVTREAQTPQEKTNMRPIQPDRPLPRLLLHKWAEGDDKERDLLRDLAVDFTMSYRRYQANEMPYRGNRINLNASSYGLMYRRHMGMQDAEMLKLFRFMDTVGLYRGQEDLYRDLIGSYEVFRRNRVDS